jgi:glycosidase
MLKTMKRPQKNQNPSLYEVNSRLFCRELSTQLGRHITLDTIPDEHLDAWQRLGFDYLWMMGVFTTGEVGHRLSLELPVLQRAYDEALPGWTDADVIGSPYAVKTYQIAAELGGEAALISLRKRLRARGMGLILDFVPNHTARDNPWVFTHPEMYIQASAEQGNDEERFFWADTHQGKKQLAYGRDPYFPSWTDTAQLNYRHKQTRKTMREVLVYLGTLCDGVRCDMAMLVLDDIIERTWGEDANISVAEEATGEFWAEAIDAVKKDHPDFLFIAEAYWDLEWRLMSLGFDYAYDKTLLDRLKGNDAGFIRGHLSAEPEYQERLVRFLENHDESHANTIFTLEKHKAAAVVALTSPGLRFFHDGQLEGRATHIPVQLGRRPEEPKSPELRAFYEKLLSVLQREALRNGTYKLLDAGPAGPNNHSHQQFIIGRFEAGAHGQCVIVVNFGAAQAQCRVPVQLRAVEGRQITLTDLLSTETFVRDGSELTQRGLFLDMKPWQAAIYWITRPHSS